jgi:hypothetical protein
MISSDEICQRVIDLYEAQAAANAGVIDLEALKRGAARAIWPDHWSDDLSLDDLPPNIQRCLEKIVNAALLRHSMDKMFDDIASRE